MGSKKRKNRSWASRLFRFFGKVLVYGFLLSVVYIFFCKWINPPFTITQVSAIFEGYDIHRDYISYNDMGNNIKLAVMAGEDQLFPDHNGFDFKSIEKALKHNQKNKSLHGASTISQQTAKNVFLWQHGGWFRKGLEVYFTFMIEHIWGKQRILEMYLNVAQMGPGVFGTEAAAQYYFHKNSGDLSRAEAAQIASCLPNPVKFTIHPMSGRVASRYPWILNQMRNLQSDPDILNILHK